MKNVNFVRLVFIVLSATVVFAVYGYVSYYGYAFDDAIYKTLQLLKNAHFCTLYTQFIGEFLYI